jgi:hypothetical protein
MKVIKLCQSYMLLGIIVLVIGCGPSIKYAPTTNLPADLPDNIRQHINGLYAVAPSDRANAAQYLGKLGKEASMAVPFLIDALGDKRKIWQDLIERDGVWTSTRSGKTFGAINYSSSLQSTVCFEVSSALHEITGQDFKYDESKWREWWEKNKPN